MTEKEMVNSLKIILQEAEKEGHDLGFASSFFVAGEWLLALIEIEAIPDSDFRKRFEGEFRDIRQFMDNPEDPYR